MFVLLEIARIYKALAIFCLKITTLEIKFNFGTCLITEFCSCIIGRTTHTSGSLSWSTQFFM